MLGWRMWWETREFFAEDPFREVLGIVGLVDSDDCVAGNTCLPLITLS
jgi:hypothetical protein